MIRAGISGVGLIAPNIMNWAEGLDLLVSGRSYAATTDFPSMALGLLPANERRRTTKLIKMALLCGQDALTGWDRGATDLATVFATSCGDLEMVDRILVALNLPGKPVSPTHFHNSVHNAAAGYWSIAVSSNAASTSLSAYDATFAAGLLEAATQVRVENSPVLMVAFDSPPPKALYPFRPLAAPFSVALLLTADAGSWSMTIEVAETSKYTAMGSPGLETLRRGNPAARSLPVLGCLASEEGGSVCIPYLNGLGLNVNISQC